MPARLHGIDEAPLQDIDLGFLPATELAALYRRKALSPVEVAKAILRHIETQEPRLNATTMLTTDLALQQARAAAAIFQKGEAAGPLTGIPVTLKDLHPTKG
ncbi:MAG: hypothetical protein J0H57_21025, partial [Rhodospirillales bacterium]|nr:hypothetical protein [Rhodospirillales bacterium]